MFYIIDAMFYISVLIQHYTLALAFLINTMAETTRMSDNQCIGYFGFSSAAKRLREKETGLKGLRCLRKLIDY